MRKVIAIILSSIVLMNFEVIPSKALVDEGSVLLSPNQNLDLVVMPYVVCVEEFGCLVATIGSVNYAVPLYKQSVSNNSDALPDQILGQATPWKNNPLYRTGKTSSQCGITETIGSVGCHLVSFAMVVSYFTGVNHFPDVVNDKIGLDSTPAISNDAVGRGTTCLFNVKTFSNFYLDSIIYDEDRTQTRKSYKSISDIAFIEPYVRSGEIVMVYGKNSSGQTHYVVVKGVDGTRVVYDSGYVDIEVNDFYINDPSMNRLTLSQFLKDYQTITDIYVFKKK